MSASRQESPSQQQLQAPINTYCPSSDYCVLMLLNLRTCLGKLFRQHFITISYIDISESYRDVYQMCKC